MCPFPSPAALLEVRLVFETAMGAVFAFKCCTAPADLNVEIQVRNTGGEPIRLASHCDMAGPGEARRIHLFPQGERLVRPGEIAAFYCWLDEDCLARFDRIVLFDSDGRPCSHPLPGPDSCPG